MSSRINKEWINENNFKTTTYKDGVVEFLKFLCEHTSGDKHPCPCRRCRNGTGQRDVGDIFVHLMEYGMVQDYTLWHFHGEMPVINQIHQPPQLHNVINPTEPLDESNFPRLDELVNDACEMFTGEAGPSIPSCGRSDGDHRGSEVPNDPQTHKGKKYERLHRLATQPLYSSTGESHHTTMYALLKLNDLKTQFSLSDGATGAVLGLLNELLPEGNNLTISYTEAKNMIKDLGMDYVKYDVCINNCMLFWKEHEHSQKCLLCGAERYVLSSRYDNGEKMVDAKGLPKFRKVAQKVIRHFPLIPRLKRLYTVKWIAEKMTWHAQAKSSFEFLRHPRDSSDWVNANTMWKEFAKKPRNVRLAIATDGFSPNNMYGRSYSCWPVIIQPLNLPPSLCMKSEFSLLTILISGPKSPKSRIDVFLQPLIDELKLLWSGVEAWDADKNEYFQLKAMLMWGIHDFPAYGMLSGCVTQGHYACSICCRHTPSEHLPKSKKCCYLRSRMFLPRDHRYRFNTSKQTFNGKKEVDALEIDRTMYDSVLEENEKLCELLDSEFD